MPQVVAERWVPVSPAIAFAVSQTTGDLRLRWDPFIRRQHLIGADRPAKGVRTATTARLGPALLSPRMVSEYVSYRPPTSVGMTMISGPWFFAAFGGGWRFSPATRDGTAGCTASWKYTFRTRPSWLAPVADRIGLWLLGREIEARIEAFAAACRDPEILAAVGAAPEAGSRPVRPRQRLLERRTRVNGLEVHFRESGHRRDAPVLVHVHGFGLSGRYLLPTAERLAGDFHNLVPDLPGFGRSARLRPSPGITELADALAAFLDERQIEQATLVGNSLGCAISAEFGHRHPDRLQRAILVSPAGGVHNRPLTTACRQLARDGLREPTRLLPVVVPDYVRFGVPSTIDLFRALTRYPALERLLELRKPTLAVIGSRDPLMPGPARLTEVAAQQENHALLVVIDPAAHAINFSHPDELAHAIRQFMADRPITDDSSAPGRATCYELHRGIHLPPVTR